MSYYYRMLNTKPIKSKNDTTELFNHMQPGKNIINAFSEAEPNIKKITDKLNKAETSLRIASDKISKFSPTPVEKITMQPEQKPNFTPNNEINSFEIIDIKESAKSKISERESEKKITEISDKIISSQKCDVKKPNCEKIMVDTKKKKFKIYDSDLEQNKGNFSIYDLVKYLAEPFNNDNKFLPEYGSEKSKKIIMENILIVIKDKQSYNIEIKDFTQSGFMGDLGLVIKLNQMLINYENKEMDNDLEKNVNKEKIQQIIKKGIISIENYTLELINIILNKNCSIISNDLRINLINYSTILMKRINCYTLEKITKINEQSVKIKELIKENDKMNDKIKENLESILQKINELIDKKEAEKIIEGGKHPEMSASSQYNVKNNSEYSMIY